MSATPVDEQVQHKATHRAKHLLGKAVHRSRALSVDGLLERLFTKAFNGLVYAQIWEDPEVDMRAMQIEPHHHVVAIASGGCNVLSYLAADPAHVTAVDLSSAHVALLKLKIAGLSRLPDWRTFYRFFGIAKARENIKDYHTYLKSGLDSETRAYWEGRNFRGRRRLTHFRTNIYSKGLLGKFIGAGHLVAKLGGADLGGLLNAPTLEDQRKHFESEIAPMFDRRLVRWLTSYRASLFGLGIPPAQYESLADGREMADVLKQRLKTLACDFPVSENYFAWQAFGRGYAPDGQGPLPPYLQPERFDEIRERAKRVEVRHASLTEVLKQAQPASVHRFVLLDAQDWMTDEQLNSLWSAITHAAAPHARVIFRTAGHETILPGRVENSILQRWSYLHDLSHELGKQDRSSIYGGFHIYELTQGN